MIEKIVEEIKSINPYEFEKMLDEFEKENEMIEIHSDTIIIGDIHGDLDSLIELVKLRKNEKIIFLGDYGDRGYYQVEVYYFLLRLKEKLKNDIILLRGNHEYPEIEFLPHDLPRSLLSKFGNKAYKIYEKIKEFWKKLSFFAILNDKYFLVHGGVPIETPKINELPNNKEYIVQLLWNDPTEENNIIPSFRGIGYLFPKEVTEKFLQKNSLEIIIRSHEACNGIKENHDGKIITVFSMKGIYGNENIGALRITKKSFEKILI
jgi:protein phosphatase